MSGERDRQAPAVPAGALFVYGVVPAGFEPPAPSGVGDAPVRVIGTGELGALVSELPEGHVPGTRADLEAHARVVAGAVEAGTIVPVRFGMVFDDELELRRRLLEDRRDELIELLRELDGRIQVTVKAIYDEGVLFREVAATEPRIARLSEAIRDRPDAEVHAEKIHLGEMVAAVVERRRAADEQALVDRLAPVAERVLVEPPRNERIALHAQLLIHRDRRGELDRLVADLAEQLGGRMTLRYVGPLAPWSFADVQLEPGEAAWA